MKEENIESQRIIVKALLGLYQKLSHVEAEENEEK
jgi:hypothetical protein